MPKAVDQHPQSRGTGNALYNPLRNGVASWEDPLSAIGHDMQGIGGGFRDLFSSIGALFGLPTPEEIIVGVANGVGSVIAGAVDLIGGLGGFFAGLVGGLLNPLQIPVLDPTKVLNLPQLIVDVGSTINGLIRGFTGLFGLSWGAEAVEAAAEAIARQAADTAAAVAKLQQLNSANAQSGNSGFVDFTGKPDAASMGASFDQTYSGAGTDTLGLVGGRAAVTPGTYTAGRVCRFVYNPKKSLTDYQRVSIVFATSPGWRQFGFPWALQYSFGYNFIRARVAEAGAYAGIDCVMVIFDVDSFDLGCVVNGVWTKWVTVPFAFRPGAIYSLDAGSVGGDRQYKVFVNSALLYTHNEVGTASGKSADHRRTGGGAEWTVGDDGNGGRFPAVPAAIAAFYMADNAPAAMLLSLGRVFRSSATLVSMPSISTVYDFPAGFFDTFDYATNDLAWNATAGTWTVSRKGNYVVAAQMVCQTTSMSGYPVLCKNGGAISAGTSGGASLVVASLPLESGDVLSLKFFTATANVQLTSTPSGVYSYFEVMRITPDMLEDVAA